VNNETNQDDEVASSQVSDDSLHISRSGWIKVSPTNSGSIKILGLQTMIEGSPNYSIVTVYEPKTKELKRLFTSKRPEYNMTIQMKCLKSVFDTIYILFGYKDMNDFFALAINFSQQRIRLFYNNAEYGNHFNSNESALNQYELKEIQLKLDQFYTFQLNVMENRFDFIINDRHAATAGNAWDVCGND
jgi:hypothetical protein